MVAIRYFAVITVAFWAFGFGQISGAADGLWQALDDGGRGVVVGVVDGDTVTLASGATVRLVGIQAPKLPLGRPGFTAWPLAEQAKKHLLGLLMNQPVRLYYGGRRIDRYGRKLAHLWRADKHGRPDLWVQGAVLEDGFARVYTFDDNRALSREMLARETLARRSSAAIWRSGFYQLRIPEETGRLIDTFQVVSGRVVSTASVRGRGYLNFGEDWRTDFTVTFAPKVLRKFPELAAALPTYQGKKIRVRGWIKRYNGPMIEVTHPEQIEFALAAVTEESTSERGDDPAND